MTDCFSGPTNLAHTDNSRDYPATKLPPASPTEQAHLQGGGFTASQVADLARQLTGHSNRPAASMGQLSAWLRQHGLPSDSDTSSSILRALSQQQGPHAQLPSTKHHSSGSGRLYDHLVASASQPSQEAAALQLLASQQREREQSLGPDASSRLLSLAVRHGDGDGDTRVWPSMAQAHTPSVPDKAQTILQIMRAACSDSVRRSGLQLQSPLEAEGVMPQRQRQPQPQHPVHDRQYRMDLRGTLPSLCGQLGLLEYGRRLSACPPGPGWTQQGEGDGAALRGHLPASGAPRRHPSASGIKVESGYQQHHYRSDAPRSDATALRRDEVSLDAPPAKQSGRGRPRLAAGAAFAAASPSPAAGSWAPTPSVAGPGPLLLSELLLDKALQEKTQEKNRASQRKFRLRQKEKMSQLEQSADAAQEQLEKVAADNEALRLRNAELESGFTVHDAQFATPPNIVLTRSVQAALLAASASAPLIEDSGTAMPDGASLALAAQPSLAVTSAPVSGPASVPGNSEGGSPDASALQLPEIRDACGPPACEVPPCGSVDAGIVTGGCPSGGGEVPLVAVCPTTSLSHTTEACAPLLLEAPHCEAPALPARAPRASGAAGGAGLPVWAGGVAHAHMRGEAEELVISFEHLVGCWRDGVMELSQHLHSRTSMLPSSSSSVLAGAGRCREVMTALSNLCLHVALTSASTIKHLVSTNLDDPGTTQPTGAGIMSPCFWEGLVAALALSDPQIYAVVRARDTLLPRLQDVLQERCAIAAALSSTGVPLTLSCSAVCGSSLKAKALFERLQSNLVREDRAMMEFWSVMVKDVFDTQQMAQAAVLAWPRFPDMLAISNVVSSQLR